MRYLFRLKTEHVGGSRISIYRVIKLIILIVAIPSSQILNWFCAYGLTVRHSRCHYVVT